MATIFEQCGKAAAYVQVLEFRVENKQPSSPQQFVRELWASSAPNRIHNPIMMWKRNVFSKYWNFLNHLHLIPRLSDVSKSESSTQITPAQCFYDSLPWLILSASLCTRRVHVHVSCICVICTWVRMTRDYPKNNEERKKTRPSSERDTETIENAATLNNGSHQFRVKSHRKKKSNSKCSRSEPATAKNENEIKRQ